MTASPFLNRFVYLAILGGGGGGGFLEKKELPKESLRQICPNTELFLRNNSVFGYLSRSE